MMSINKIIDVNEIDFDYEVIAYSQNIPVVVDFWAEWCTPCKTLSPLLEELVNESEGDIRLARVNVDQNPNLAQMYNVHNIPTIKAITQGQVVAEFAGLQSKERVREFLTKITPPSATDLDIEKGINLLNLGDWSQAEKIFTNILETKSESPAALLGYSKALLAQGRAEEVLDILSNFPTSREYPGAQFLLPLSQALVDYQQKKLPEETDLDYAFNNCIRLISNGKLQPALDGLLDILRQDKHYRSKLAQELVLGLLEVLGNDNPLSRDYRTELSTILF